MLILTLAWSLSSSVGSQPDDDFHLASIWCTSEVAQPGSQCGEVTGADGATGFRTVLLPERLTRAPECFAFRPEVSAACATSFDDDLHPSLANDGLYPDGFYSTMNVLAGDDIQTSVLMMRWLNAAVAAGLFAAALVLAPVGVRQGLALATIALFIPLGAFFVPATSPSSWTISSVSTLWVFVLRFLVAERVRDPGAIAALLFSVIAAAMALSSRTDAAAFVGLSMIIAALLARDFTGRWTSRRLFLPLLVGVAASWVFLRSSTSDFVFQGATPLDGSEPGRSGFTLLAGNVFRFGDYVLGWFGLGWGLGWLDTMLPSTVGAIGLGLFLVLATRTYSDWTLGKAAAVALGGSMLVAIPLTILQSSNARIGEIVQPRYLYPLALVVAAVLLCDVARHRHVRTGGVLGPGLMAVASLGPAVMGTIALHTNIRRYVTGRDVVGLNLEAGREWWWSGSFPGPHSVLFIGFLAALGLAASLALIARADQWSSRPGGRAESLHGLSDGSS